ncbi:hypothetical protein IT575_10125 [bacterium]|nr:hypothetical protein [bacterium]
MIGPDPPVVYDVLTSQPATKVTYKAADTRLPHWRGLRGPLARNLGKALYHLVGTSDPYDLSYVHGNFYAQSEYRQWVRRRLREDNFMARIGAGIEMFPDIREELPPVQRWIENQHRPRTMPSMMRHMSRNLEWYLRPGSLPVFSRKLLPSLGWMLGSGLGSLLCAFSAYSQSGAPELWSILSGFGALMGLLLAVAAALKVLAEIASFGTACGEKPGSMKHTINAAELYLYLLELYEERPAVALDMADLPPADQSVTASPAGISNLDGIPQQALAALDPAVLEGSLAEARRRLDSRSQDSQPLT